MKTIKINNSKYPALLKQISSPPEKLYYKGNWDKRLFERCLSVVGSRQMTNYGRRVTEQLIFKAAAAGITIVSGFMYGVDAQAHKTALAAGGKTIAVMPCGIDLIHPAHQKNLYEEIISSGGLVISEIEGDFLPQLWTYPKRNRIVAGLSQAVLVIEAGRESGSLITAEFAKKYGRRLFSVPGPINSVVSQGTLQLIKEGADMALSASDILSAYGLAETEISAEKIPALSLNKLEQAILEKLIHEPKEIDELSRLLSVSASKLGAALSLMQLRGIIVKEEGKYYVSKSSVSVKSGD